MDDVSISVLPSAEALNISHTIFLKPCQNQKNHNTIYLQMVILPDVEKDPHQNEVNPISWTLK